MTEEQTEAAPTQERWIPVAEKMPDDCITVLIACRGDGEPVWFGFWDTADGCWRDAGTGERVTDEVTHWREMPAGPQFSD